MVYKVSQPDAAGLPCSDPDCLLTTAAPAAMFWEVHGRGGPPQGHQLAGFAHELIVEVHSCMCDCVGRSAMSGAQVASWPGQESSAVPIAAHRTMILR
jgi:hypothetical protein